VGKKWDYNYTVVDDNWVGFVTGSCWDDCEWGGLPFNFGWVQGLILATFSCIV